MPWRGRCLLLAGLLPAALAATALFPAAASADYTRGFHIYNFSRYPIQLRSIDGGQFDGTPPIGSVLQPGEGYQDFEMVWNFAQANTANIWYRANGGALNSANIKVGGFGETSSTCQASYGQCSAGGTTITFYDAPGTVIDIPAGQGQQQAAALTQLCNESNAATCTFAATSETKVLSPPHTVGKPLLNYTDEEQETKLTAEDTVGSTDSVEVGLKVGGKIAGLVEVEVDAKYGHEWTQEHKFSQEVKVFCPAHHACWLEAVEPMFRDTGDFTMTLGNTTWHLHDVYFDSPNPNGTGAYAVKDCELGTTGCPSEGAKLGASGPPKVLSGTYTPPPRLDASRLVDSTLHLAIAGPSRVTAGHRASYRVTLSRTQPDRFAYALTDVRVVGKAAARPADRWRLDGLGEKGSRALKLDAKVPANAHGSFCVTVSAAAKHAHDARARDCVPVAR